MIPLPRVSSVRMAIATFGLAAVAVGCVSPDPFRIPRDRRDLFEHIAPLEYTVPGHAKFLDGVRICLDPGHGGDGHIPKYKRGPTGVREAEVNLRVATYLKAFLEQAGAEVLLTREGDVQVSLAERADIANRNRVDFFISMHHNASGPKANFTSTWFHGEPDDAPSGLDLARHLQVGVSETLQLPQTAPNGLKSDYLIYPGSGFGVLRRLTVNGALMESSFHSNPDEEQRLDTPWYNRREAYGYFLGIARYVAGGLPKARMLFPEAGGRIPSKRPTIRLALSDGLRERGGWGSDRNWVFADAIRLFLDNRPVLDFEYDNASGELTFTPANPLENTAHTVRVAYRNLSGNHVLPHELRFVVAPPADDIRLLATPPVLNADGFGYTRLDVEIVDADGLAVADETEVCIESDAGSLRDTRLRTRDGRVETFLTSTTQPREIVLRIISGPMARRFAVPVRIGAKSLVYARTLDIEGDPIDGVTLRIGDRQTATRQGRGILDLSDIQRLGPKDIYAARPGYFTTQAHLEVGRSMSNFIAATMYPVLGGCLQDKVFIIDPRYGGRESGVVDSVGNRAADLNLQVALRLREFFAAAGARVTLLRESDSDVAVDTRIRKANDIGVGAYLRIEHGLYEPDKKGFELQIYPSPKSRSRGQKLIPAMASFLDMKGGEPVPSKDPEIKNTKMIANSLLYRTLDHPREDVDASDPGFLDREAQAVLMAFALLYDLPEASRCSQAFRITRADTGAPIMGADLLLDQTLPLRSDRRGEACFEGLRERRAVVTVECRGFKSATMACDVPSGGIVDVALELEQ